MSTVRRARVRKTVRKTPPTSRQLKSALSYYAMEGGFEEFGVRPPPRLKDSRRILLRHKMIRVNDTLTRKGFMALMAGGFTDREFSERGFAKSDVLSYTRSGTSRRIARATKKRARRRRR